MPWPWTNTPFNMHLHTLPKKIIKKTVILKETALQLIHTHLQDSSHITHTIYIMALYRLTQAAEGVVLLSVTEVTEPFLIKEKKTGCE